MRCDVEEMVTRNGIASSLRYFSIEPEARAVIILMLVTGSGEIRPETARMEFEM